MSDSFDLVFTSWYKAERLKLSKEDRDRIDRKLRDFRNMGWSAAMGSRSVRHLSDGIHEFRILGRGAAYRVLFFVMPSRAPRMVVLTACARKAMIKKRRRMDAEVERARARRAQWLEQQKGQGANGGR